MGTIKILLQEDGARGTNNIRSDVEGTRQARSFLMAAVKVDLVPRFDRLCTETRRLPTILSVVNIVSMNWMIFLLLFLFL